MQIVINLKWWKGKPSVWTEYYKTHKWAKRRDKEEEPPEPPTVQQEVLAI